MARTQEFYKTLSYSKREAASFSKYPKASELVVTSQISVLPVERSFTVIGQSLVPRLQCLS